MQYIYQLLSAFIRFDVYKDSVLFATSAKFYYREKYNGTGYLYLRDCVINAFVQYKVRQTITTYEALQSPLAFFYNAFRSISRSQVYQV